MDVDNQVRVNQRLYDLAKAFDTGAKKHNLTYWATKGTMLGTPYLAAPLTLCSGGKVDSVYLIATVPWTCIGGDTSFTKSRKMPRRAIV